jgi:chromate transporter
MTSDPPGLPEPPLTCVGWRESLPVWLRVAALSFGGPAGQIAVMHRILVEEKRWLDETRFLHAMNYCMLLPGPEAQQLATYSGWLLQGWRGGLVAGGLFILPGCLAILLLSVLYAGFRDVAIVSALFFGLKPAVLAIVVQAVHKIGQRALNGGLSIAIAAAAFVAIFVLQIDFPYVVLGAGAVGWLASLRFTHWLEGRPSSKTTNGAGQSDADHGDSVRVAYSAEAQRPPALGRSLRTLTLWLAIWALPALIVLATLGRAHVLFTQAIFFSQTAVVTFGGAYSVLAYIAQRAVEDYAWLSPDEMLDGLGMAETTPGPLIQVVQFVGFMGAFRNAAPFESAWLAATLGSLVTVWVTYAPCFLWIFLGAPYMETVRRNPRLRLMLRAVTSAVTGVILNLAVWFAVHTLFGETIPLRYGWLQMTLPAFHTIIWPAFALAMLAFVLLFALRASMLVTLGISTILGMAYWMAFGPGPG